MIKSLELAIVGAGAAGLFAAVIASEQGCRVTLFEKNAYVGKKLMITGKGRCNVTNNCSVDEFIKNVPVNGRFLYSALNSFTPDDTIAFFESIGVPLKTERGNRVFPVSDKARDIQKALLDRCLKLGVKIIYEKITKIEKIDNTFTIRSSLCERRFDKVILSTGGKSYPLTGSDGDGYRFAASFGHTVITPKPSLVPLVAEEKFCASLMGLSLKNVALRLIDSSNLKSVYNDFGEMLFTHFGISGPMALSASSHVRDIGAKKYIVEIDLKPALDEEALDKRILKDFEKYKNKDFKNALNDLLPLKMIPVFIKLTEISPTKKINEISKAERKKIIQLLKHFTLTVTATRPIDEAIITSGGVKTSEISPSTMESKLIDGLYFAGEIIDVDAYTGGFNLQIAFSTAYCAAMAASQI